jgi:DNA mismatch endonuclease, patch repair protein
MTQSRHEFVTASGLLTDRKRSQLMSRIRGKNTKPELLLRRAIHARGLRYRLHDSRLPGKPDIVFMTRRAVVFVNGCYWHGHNCDLFRWPKANSGFWQNKILSNRRRDRHKVQELLSLGWRVLTVWECALRAPDALPITAVVDRCVAWLNSDKPVEELRSPQHSKRTSNLVK